MTTFSRRLLQWASRVLSIAFIVLLSLFALDSLSQGLAVIAMHLLPSFALTAVLLLAWRWE